MGASSCRSRESTGVPWTESEHLAFLVGLKKLGKGNWRGVSRYFVPTRTPTQVASHAQKHFLRLQGVSKRKSRFSLVEKTVRDPRKDGPQRRKIPFVYAFPC